MLYFPNLEPFPFDRLRDLWAWLKQFPENNFDDEGPRTLGELDAMLRARLDGGEYLFAVRDAAGELCGAVGFQLCASHLGMFRGIVFDRRVHGTGIAAAAVQRVIDAAFAAGISKVSALYYADNPRIHRFLQKLGAKPEGLLRKHAPRGGQLVDVRVAAIFQ